MTEQPSLRIAMLSVHTCPLATLGGKKTGGMNVYIRELSQELGKKGIKVDIFTRSQDPCIPHVNDRLLVAGVRVIHIPAGPEAPLASPDIYSYLPEFVENVLTFASSEGLSYDIIHSHYWLSGWVAEKLSEQWHVPVLQMFHTLGRMKNRITSDPEQHDPPLRLEIEKRVIDSADMLIAATPAERIQMMWLYGANMRNIHVISPGVDLEQFHPIPKAKARRCLGLPDDHKLLLFVGRIERLKGLDTLLKAINLLNTQLGDETLNNMCLSIIGGDPDAVDTDAEMNRLHTLRQALDLEELVTFLGAKSQDTLQYYYSAAEAVIMPSHYESFGMVALEAMACGTPVVASEVGGLAYLVQDGVTGFHVPDREPDVLAGRIKLLLENDALRQEMSAAAVKSARAYAWPNIASQIIKLYCESLATAGKL